MVVVDVDISIQPDPPTNSPFEGKQNATVGVQPQEQEIYLMKKSDNNGNTNEENDDNYKQNVENHRDNYT